MTVENIFFIGRKKVGYLIQICSESMDMKTPKRDRESSDAVEEPLEKFTSPMELCIHVLKSHGLLKGEWDPSAYTSELPCPNDPCPQPCKICGDLENPSEMLICDHCEEAYHLSCSSPKVEKVPAGDWYCQACFGEKPKPSLLGSSSTNDGKQSYRDQLSIMLQETKSYISAVRVGKYFQAEVADWSGPTSMAPLSEAQADDWDCSWAVLWDPIHADCAVPQELATKDVLKQLEFVKMLNDRLAARQLQMAKDPRHPSSGERARLK